MKQCIKALVMAFTLLASIDSGSQQTADPQAWEREEAWRASASVNSRMEADQLQEFLRTGDDAGSLRLIREITLNERWPAPARERVIYEYVSALRKEPPSAVGHEVIDFLKGFQSTVWVPHDDHPHASVPLFNIKGAATGVVNEWSRQEAAFEGATLVATDPAHLVLAYQQEQDAPRKRGLLDSLDTASRLQLAAVSQAVLPEISRHPELIAVAHRAAINSKDISALTELAENGRGAEMHRVFRDSAVLFDIPQTQHLLEAALRNPSYETAALAIAQFALVLGGNEATEHLLIQLLDDPQLGSSAALALAAKPSATALHSLELLADSGKNELFATRARLALKIHASGMTGQMHK